MITGLSVVEARWWDDGNHSVRSLFETACGIAVSNPFGFRYDMFCDRSSLETIVGQVAANAKFHTIYVAAHGDANNIQGSPGNLISRAILRNIIRNANVNFTVTGLYFGSCLICNQANAEFLLDRQNGAGVNWIAGYSNSVDWVTSSSIDMLYWSFFFAERDRNRRRRRDKKSDLAIARFAASEMRNLMPTVFQQLGFNLYYRDNGGQLTSVWN